MGTHRVFSILLFSCFLLLFLSPGFGVEVFGTVEHAASIYTPEKEYVGISRKMIVDVADYPDPGPNRPVAYRNHRSPPPAKA